VARYLVVAHQTSEAQEFIDTVCVIADRDGDAKFVLLVPETHVQHLATWTEGESRAVALKKAAAARRRTGRRRSQRRGHTSGRLTTFRRDHGHSWG
jgi:hypothetical protein